MADIDIGTTDMLLLTLLNESSNDIGNSNPLESKSLSKPREESRRPTRSERAKVEQGRPRNIQSGPRRSMHALGLSTRGSRLISRGKAPI